MVARARNIIVPPRGEMFVLSSRFRVLTPASNCPHLQCDWVPSLAHRPRHLCLHLSCLCVCVCVCARARARTCVCVLSQQTSSQSGGPLGSDQERMHASAHARHLQLHQAPESPLPTTAAVTQTCWQHILTFCLACMHTVAQTDEEGQKVNK